MSERRPDDLLELLEKAEKDENGLPPVHEWNPEHCADIDMRIARDGTWYYQGSPIQRHRMVKLFSTVIRRDGNDYFLVTPVEKLRIQVDDAPFVATGLTVVEDDQKRPVLVFTTNVDATVVADGDHPLRVDTDEQTGEPSPYILVRDNLEALISRNVFYELVDRGKTVQNGDGNQLVVTSGASRFPLGAL